METASLLDWYKANARPLPWRESRDPYRIWISEIMLQQTTVKAVVPYFEKFLARFPDVQALARSTIEDVYEYWAGLGYYSRARNLHKASLIIAKSGFPKSHSELMLLPGLGPYTARAVASFAFSEPVGVLDGNVTRFLSRYHGKKVEFWRPSERRKLQLLADQWVTNFDSHDVNQALIEVGATICTPSKPFCVLCPVAHSCWASRNRATERLPLSKPRRQLEHWIWEPVVAKMNHKIAFTKQHSLPVLKQQLALPGKSRKVAKAPKRFDFKHTVTHHNLYVRVIKSKKMTPAENMEWLHLKEIVKKSPASLIKKALEAASR